MITSQLLLLDPGVFTVVDVDWLSRCTVKTATSPKMSPPALKYIAVPNMIIEMRYSMTSSRPYQKNRRTLRRRVSKSRRRKR
jgi:hypothetical protein